MFKGIIRELKKEDAEAVKGILGLYWDGELKERFIQRMMNFLDKTPESIEQKYKYFVAEENGEIVGVGVSRNAPEHMKQYVQTNNPVEFYLLAVKDMNRGIGTALGEKMFGEAKNDGYTEVVFYSAESHKDSWDFYDNSDFKRAGPSVAPNGEKGFIWRRDFGLY